MGRKRQAKLQRRLAGNSAPAARPSGGSFRWDWLLGAVGVTAVLIAAVVVLVQRNQDKILQAALGATVTQVETRLQADSGRLPYPTVRELSALLAQCRTLTLAPGLDARSGGQVRLVVGVIEEIIRSGRVEPGELAKLDALLEQVRQYLQQRAGPKAGARAPARP